MKKIVVYGPILICLGIVLVSYLTKLRGDLMKLPPAPQGIEKWHEIAIQYSEELPKHFNALTPQERVFIYYLFRASLPGNRISADQHHRNALTIRSLFENILNHADELQDIPTEMLDVQQFMHDVKTYLVYVWTNHGNYFVREHANEKRTPQKLGLTTLTKENLLWVLKKLSVSDTENLVESLNQSIFDETYEPTLTIPDNIASSAVNFYAPDFTEEDYAKLEPQQRSALNAYFYVEQQRNKRIPMMSLYSSQGTYAKELETSVYWLTKAYNHAKKYHQQFDEFFVKSLDYLIKYLQTGDEELFKLHSIEWLKSSSRLDYNFGFIETYQDPKGHRGSFQAEVTIKTVDMQKLNSILPNIEAQLPFPPEFKRDVSSATKIPNASINEQVFGIGGLGPLLITAAYCLPNYEEIREGHGSKQIIYPASKGLAAKINPHLATVLFYPKKDADWLLKHDPELELGNDIWNVQCILHETLGHGSGKLATHIFKDGAKLTVGGTTYRIGDTLQVTNQNISELLAGYESTIEEMRAEVLALYVSVFHLDALIAQGLLNKWVPSLGKDGLIRWLIIKMAATGLRRILQQSDGATQIDGDHARANYTIMNYLIDHGGLTLVEEKITIDEKEYTVLGLDIVDLEKTKKLITELTKLVQHIKSTGDGLEAKKLVDTYGIKLRDPQHPKILKENNKSIVGDLKISAMLPPWLIPITNQAGDVTDVKATWPQTIFEQYEKYAQLEVSKA